MDLSQPAFNPSVPFDCDLKSGFPPGVLVRVQGFVPPDAEKFNINLKCGPGDGADVALHVSVRLLQNYVARNTFANGIWDDEQGDGALPIGLGQNFEIILLCTPEDYKIAINGQHYCEYSHKVSIRTVSHLLIDGDVKLSVVALEGNAPSHSAENANQSFETPSAPLSQYGPPSGGQYGPPAGGQYGPPQGGYGQPPPPPGSKDDSGLDNILETASAAIAGAVSSGAAEKFLGEIMGNKGSAGQPGHTQQMGPPQHNPAAAPAGGLDLGGLLQSITGGAGQQGHNQQPQGGLDLGSLLQSLSGTGHQAAPHPASSQSQGGLGDLGSLLQSLGGGAHQAPHHQGGQGGGGLDLGSLLQSFTGNSTPHTQQQYHQNQSAPSQTSPSSQLPHIPQLGGEGAIGGLGSMTPLLQQLAGYVAAQQQQQQQQKKD